MTGISRTSLDAMSTLELSSVGAINLVVAENLSWPEHVAKTAIIQQALLSCDRALLMEALSRFLPILTVNHQIDYFFLVSSSSFN